MLLNFKAKGAGLYALLFLLYLATAYLLSFISLQSQVVPLWYPAGIALIGCFVFGWRFIPAILLGSLIFNMDQTGLDNITSESLNGLFLMALGSAFQGIIGGMLLRKFVGNPLRSQSYWQLVFFVIVIGIIVNLIAANIGVFSLTQFNDSYPKDNFLFNVTQWWLGDSLGVLLVTPIFFALYDPDKHNQNSQYLIWVPVFLSLVILTLDLFFNQSIVDSKNNIVERESQTLENSFYKQLYNVQGELLSLAGFINSTRELSAQEFHEYAEPIINENKTIKALSWNPVIAQSNKDDFEAEMYRIYGEEKNIKGGALVADDPYVVVKHISPLKGNEGAVGFNVYSNPSRKEALDQAKDGYRPVSTSVIQLVQSSKQEAAFLIFAPVYKHDEENSGIIRGFATGVFLVEQIIENALELDYQQLFYLRIYENEKDEAFYTNLPVYDEEAGNVSKQLHFSFAGQSWRVDLILKPNRYSSFHKQKSLLLHVFQILITCCLILFILLVYNRERILNKKVSERTIKLATAKKEAEQANVAKSGFLANMSHEIRTPMNSVLGFARLARETKDQKQRIDYVTRIESSSKILLNIVNDILDFSKIESSKVTLEKVSFDMTDVLQRIDIMFRGMAEDKGLSWELDNQLLKDTCFLGDPVRVEQVMMNLCSNAIKFTEKGKVSLVVEQITEKSGELQLRISVKDTGIGIEDSDIDKLFNLFTQVDESTSRRYGGTGLGLSIAKKLSLLMDGDISVVSKVGVGSTFIFDFKTQVTKEEPVTQSKHSAVEVISMNVLVAEDNSVNQAVIRATLQSLGVTPDIVNNGSEAIEAVKQSNYDLVLMDCQMPVMDGYEATHCIRKELNLENLAIVALTADVTTESKRKAFESGMNEHLTKPVDKDKLKEVLIKYSTHGN